MISYRIATPEDAEAIAMLHAKSWQENYKGIWSDQYLDHEVVPNRLSIWKKRFEKPNPEQYVKLALDGEDLCGFACTYLNYDKKWGAFLDNLHVRSDYQGNGIGKFLMKDSARWVQNKDAQSGLFLLVLENNQSAIKFYEKIGGQYIDKTMYNNPGGGQSPIFTYAWNDLGALL